MAPVPSGFEEIGEFAGRTFDYQAAHPQLVRLLLWEGLSGGVADEAIRSLPVDDQVLARLDAIVDDDPSVRRSLVRVVTSAGYEAVAFASAPEFLAWLSVGRAACLVLDIHMGGTSGFELQERLSVPVIFMTAHDDASIRARIEKPMAAAHLIKPFDAATLLGVIRHVTARDQLDQGPIGRPADVGQTEDPDKDTQ